MTPKSSDHFLSLIIPVYRQEKTIVANLQQIKSALDKIRYDYEIITVIDGKIDQSLEKIDTAKIGHVICLFYEINQGKSYAIRFGMEKAKGDYVMFMDAGNEIDPNGISMLLEHMEWYNADIIVGSKRHLASQVEYSFLRKVLSQGYYFFIKLLFGLKIHDTQAGIKVFKKNVLQKILPRLLEKKFAGDLEMLVVADSLGFTRIYEAPIKLNYQLSEITSAATIKEVWGIFVDTLAIFYRKNIINYYKREHKKFVFPKRFSFRKFVFFS